MEPAIAIDVSKPRGLGIIPFTPVSKLVADAAAAEQARQRLAVEERQRMVSRLGLYIEDCWSKAKRAKMQVEQRMLRSIRRRAGIYEAEKAAAIKEMGGSDVYVLLTNTKCRAAGAWILDVIRPAYERPFIVTPSPIPDLPGNIEQTISAEVRQVAMGLLGRMQQIGMQAGDDAIIQELRQYAETRIDEMRREMVAEAKLRAERMGNKISDQMTEGGWYDAFWACVDDFVTLPVCVLKGPVIRKRKVPKWMQDQNGNWAIGVVEDFVPEFDRVSPFDIYPAPDARHVDDGFLIQRHKITRKDLQSFIGVRGYKDDAIRKVLQDVTLGQHKISMLPIDSERAAIEYEGRTTAEQEGEKIEALEFWGSVPGNILIEWGLQAELDPDIDYEVNAWKVGDVVIRAVLNPDKLDRKPYSVDSFERVPGAFWGNSIPDLMADTQDICNALARAIVNNAGFASGPQVEVDIGRCGTHEQIYPMKIWPSTNQQMLEGPAVRFTQPQMVANQLMQVYEFFMTMSEDQTGIPRWAHGNANMGGAGGTSSGLSMLMTSASRSIKECIGHLDTMISKAMNRIYDYNMVYDPDPSIKGDCRITANVASSLMAREQYAIRLREILRDTANPADMQILGAEGRAELLEKSLASMDIELEALNDTEKMKRRILEYERRMLEQFQLATKGQAPPKNPQTLDAAGNPAGGTDANLMQNQPGDTPNGGV